jgi:hypothetical protein
MSNRSIRVFTVLIFAAAGVFAQRPADADLMNYGVRIEPDKRVMVVLAAMQMAGTRDAGGNFVPSLKLPLSPAGAAFRDKLIADNPELPEDLRSRITTFISNHKRLHSGTPDGELISPFVSMAYALTQPPELLDPVVTSDLPGSLLDVLDFAPLVREFYRRSTIAAKLDGYTADYKQNSKTLGASTRSMLREILDYLHTKPQLVFTEKIRVETQKTGSKQKLANIQVREHDRHFYIVPEALTPKGTVNFVNVRDDYYLVVPPDTDLTGREGRRAYLRFVVDPLVLATAKELQPVRDWAKPVLDELHKTDSSVTVDPFIAVARSLVAAADIRENEFTKLRAANDDARKKIAAMGGSDPERKVSAELDTKRKLLADEAALELYEDYQKGAVLSFFFAEQLKGVEDSGFDIASSLKDMVQSFDPAKETARVASSADARARAAAARGSRASDPQAPVSGSENTVASRLIEIQKTIAAHDLAKAQADLKGLLTNYPADPRIYYHLGRVAGLAAANLQDPESRAAKLLEAKAAYTNAINSATASTDPTLLSLTYVALGRISEFFEDEDAVKLYDKAFKLGPVKGGAYVEAKEGKERLAKPKP